MKISWIEGFVGVGDAMAFGFGFNAANASAMVLNASRRFIQVELLSAL